MDASEDVQPLWRRPAVLGGAALALVLAVTGWSYRYDILGIKPLEAGSAEQGNVAAAQPQSEDGYFVIADANVRDKPTAAGSTVTGKLPRGTKVQGTLEMGSDGTSKWIKLADGSGYVGMINLSATEPPKLLKIFNNMDWLAPRALEIRAMPDINSAIISKAPEGTMLTLAGLTDTGFAEAKMAKGGVGYFLASGLSLEPGGKPINIALQPNRCDFGPDVDALFSTLNKRAEAAVEAIEKKDFPNEEARAAALEANAEKNQYLKVGRSFKGLMLTGIGTQYEATSLYFANSPAEVKAAFKKLGFTITADSFVEGKEEGGASTSISATQGAASAYGKTELNCGV